jgi:hypothetical protein
MKTILIYLAIIFMIMLYAFPLVLYTLVNKDNYYQLAIALLCLLPSIFFIPYSLFAFIFMYKCNYNCWIGDVLDWGDMLTYEENKCL